MLDGDGAAAQVGAIMGATIVSALGLLPFAAASAGYLRGPLSWQARGLLLVAALAILFPGPVGMQLLPGLDAVNVLGLTVTGVFLLRPPRRSGQSAG
jgi:TRAP-type uncharacterized transport system fused permease subunit